MILIKARVFLAITVVQVIVLAGLFTWSVSVARARTAEEIPQSASSLSGDARGTK